MMRIGTRESKLALWQAQKVKSCFSEEHTESMLVTISSEGDTDLTTPLYEIGIQGVFTKTLDAALLQNKIDVAVHSYKDVPTVLAKGLCAAAVLERGSTNDVFIPRGNDPHLEDGCIVATSSLRRKAQWLNRYPHHQIENIRGNVQTRLQKVKDGYWAGAIFAKAGLERLQLLPANSMELDWMLPAPAQGAIVVVCRENDERTKSICSKFNHRPTALCTYAERLLLNKLNAGCSLPVGALAVIDKEGSIYLRSNVCSVDGKIKIEAEGKGSVSDIDEMVTGCARKILSSGGDKILKELNRN